MTSGTDELRRMLKERGVEWWHYKDERTTYWYGTLDGEEWGEWTATEMGGHLHLTFSANGDVVTPEQAIAATLGSCNCSCSCPNSERTETCHDEGDPSDFCCSECGVRMFTNTSDTYTMIASDGRTIIKRPNYCPNCGRRCIG